MSEDSKKVLVFHSDKGDISLSADFKSETIWATQKQIADLFGVGVPAISKHMNNIFLDGELDRTSTVSISEIVDEDGNLRKVEHYNLDVVLSVGYRVNSIKATEFRRWATSALKELISKGFVIDDNRFASAQLGAFNELIERVRAIRTSEKHFYQKITDIFATSKDYMKSSKQAADFFASVQNKIHFAVHGHTAAELIVERADASKINMGMKHLPGTDVTMADAQVAKNYLSELELKMMELLSEQFLSFAEFMYTSQNSMTMRKWADKLDEFLTLNERAILRDKGSVSRDEMLRLVGEELEKYRKKKQLKAE